MLDWRKITILCKGIDKIAGAMYNLLSIMASALTHHHHYFGFGVKCQWAAA
jgi:hypothetical protein